MPRKKIITNSSNETDALIKVREAAKLVGRSETTILDEIKKGNIRAIWAENNNAHGGRTYYLMKKADVIAWNIGFKNRLRKAPSYDGYLTTSQASRFANVCASNIRVAARSGQLPFEKRPNGNKHGYCFVFREEDVRRWKDGKLAAAKVPETIEVIEVEPKPKEAKATAGTLADFSNDELTAELVNRIKTAFNSGYEKGHAEGRKEVKAAIMSAIEAL